MQSTAHTESKPMINGFRSSTANDWRLEGDVQGNPTPVPTGAGDRESPKKPDSGPSPSDPGSGSGPGSGPGTSPSN